MQTVSRPYTFDRVVRLLIAGGGIVLAVWLINILKSVLLPFLVAWLIAYMLEPFVQYNMRLLNTRKRLLPIMMTLFEVLLVLVAMSVFILPSVISEVHQVATFITGYADKGTQIPFVPDALHEFLRTQIDFVGIASRLTRQDIQSIFNTLGSVIVGGYDIIMGVFNWFIVLLYVVFIMLDYERLLRGFRHLVPPKYRKQTFGIANDIKNSMNHYFRGQALVAFIVGILFSIGFLIVGLPLAIVMGLFIGLLNMVPYLQLISLLPTTVLCIVCSANSDVDFWSLWLATMAVYVVVQCIQDLFLTPKIMGKAMGLNPALILFSLTGWGTFLGFIGLLIALPLTTMLLSYYDMYISSREDGESPGEHRRNSRELKNMLGDEDA